MNLYVLFPLIFISAHTLAEQALSDKFRELEHANKGCLINSICSEKSGKLIIEFEKALKLKSKKKKIKALKKIHNTNGLPINILASKENGESEDAVLWNSRCRHHNPRNPNNAIYQGFAFMKKIQNESKLSFEKVVVYNKDKKVIYQLPYRDRPLFIKENRVFVLKDFEDEFYQLSFKIDGNFQVENLSSKLYSIAESRKVKEVPCPENKEETPKFFSSSYCQKIWDIDSNELKLVQVFWSCS